MEAEILDLAEKGPHPKYAGTIVADRKGMLNGVGTARQLEVGAWLVSDKGGFGR